MTQFAVNASARRNLFCYTNCVTYVPPNTNCADLDFPVVHRTTGLYVFINAIALISVLQLIILIFMFSAAA